MKAVVCEKYGPPEVLRIVEMPKPVPKDSEILIKVHATTVSAADFRVRSFTVPPSNWLMARLFLGILRPRTPVLGSELSGVVEAVGCNVTRFAPGDAVFACTATGHRFGAYAEYHCMREDQVVEKKPENLSFKEAAAVPFGGRAALHFLKQGRISAEKRVLVNGASGSLGTYGVQLAKVFGGHVTGVCSGDNLELVRSIGADEVIDYTKSDFTKNVGVYDVIFDAVGKTSVNRSMRALKEGGILLHAVASLGVTFTGLVTGLFRNKKMIGGVTAPDDSYLPFLKACIEEETVKPVIDRVFSIDEIVEAHRYADGGHKKGNVVVLLSHGELT